MMSGLCRAITRAPCQTAGRNQPISVSIYGRLADGAAFTRGDESEGCDPPLVERRQAANAVADGIPQLAPPPRRDRQASKDLRPVYLDAIGKPSEQVLVSRRAGAVVVGIDGEHRHRPFRRAKLSHRPQNPVHAGGPLRRKVRADDEHAFRPLEPDLLGPALDGDAAAGILPTWLPLAPLKVCAHVRPICGHAATACDSARGRRSVPECDRSSRPRSDRPAPP